MFLSSRNSLDERYHVFGRGKARTLDVLRIREGIAPHCGLGD